MATAFFGPAKQKAPVESSGSVPHVGLAGQSPLPIPGHAYLGAYGLKPQAESYYPFGISPKVLRPDGIFEMPLRSHNLGATAFHSRSFVACPTRLALYDVLCPRFREVGSMRGLPFSADFGRKASLNAKAEAINLFTFSAVSPLR